MTYLQLENNNVKILAVNEVDSVPQVNLGSASTPNNLPFRTAGITFPSLSGVGATGIDGHGNTHETSQLPAMAG